MSDAHDMTLSQKINRAADKAIDVILLIAELLAKSFALVLAILLAWDLGEYVTKLLIK